MTREIKLGLVQMAMHEDSEVNLERAVDGVRAAAKQGADIVCLPELFTTPYFCVNEKTAADYSITLPNSISQTLSDCARDHKVVLVGGSIYERDGESKFNTSLIFDSDGLSIGKYRKVHIPHDEGFYEQNYFTPGDMGFQVFKTKLCTFGVLICFDQWFPEAARAMALLGAEIIFYPTAIGSVDGLKQVEGEWQSAWEAVQRGHAVANNIVVAPVNRVGTEGRSTFWGGSFVCDAFGTMVAHAGNSAEILVATVDLDHNKYVRESWGFFRNRRPTQYEALVKND